MPGSITELFRQAVERNPAAAAIIAGGRIISFGQLWCANQTEQAARRQAKTDPHSTDRLRTNGTVQNFDEFGKAFGCKVGQPMMPEKSCRVW